MSREFLDKLIKDDRDVDEQESKTSGSSGEKSNVPVNNIVQTETTPLTEPQKRPQKDSVKVETREVNKLTPAEIKVLRDGLEHLSNSTPRKIRILYYRYLFIKNILIQQRTDIADNHFWLKSPNDEILMRLLIDFSQRSTSSISEERKRVFEHPESTFILEALKITVDKEQFSALLRIFELAIAY